MCVVFSFSLQVHRSCLHDDSFGVGEALNEQAFNKGLVARGSHYLLLGGFKQNPLAAQERDLAQRKLLDAWTFVSPIGSYGYEDIKSTLKLQVIIVTTNQSNVSSFFFCSILDWRAVYLKTFKS